MIALTIKRTFDAPIERVWEAWTNKAEAEIWYAPEPLTPTFEKWAGEVGEAFRLVMRQSDDAAYVAEGVIKEIKAPEKLVYTFQWVEPPPPGDETLITMQLKDLGGKTEMTFTHSGFKTEEQKEMHEHGWSSSFTKLEKLFI